MYHQSGTLLRSLRSLALKLQSKQLQVEPREALLEALAQSLRVELTEEVNVSPPNDYDYCWWLHIGSTTTIGATAQTLQGIVQQGPIKRLDVAVSLYGPIAALKWQQWRLSDRRRVERMTMLRPRTALDRKQQAAINKVMPTYNIGVVPPQFLSACLPEFVTDLDVPPTVATILLSEMW